MDSAQQDFVSFLINQGVAVGVLVFLLVRLESRMAKLETLLQSLNDRAFAQSGGYLPPASGTGTLHP